MTMFDLLNLQGVKPVDMRRSHRGITVVARPIAELHPLCEACNVPMHKHGVRTNKYADTPIQMQPVSLEVERPRYRCHSCGQMHTTPLLFLDEKRRATKRLVNVIRKQCLGTTFRALAAQTGVAINTVKNIAYDLIQDLEREVHYETPVIMGIDEVMLAGQYRCVITNLATKNIFNMLEFRTQDHLKAYFKDLPGRENVQWVCTDMWRPFKRSFAAYFPNAKLVIDKSHVVKMASEALEQEQKKSQVALSRDARLYVKKSIRWLTLKRPSSLSKQEAMAIVREEIPELAKAYDIKETFYEIYDKPTKKEAQDAFKDWEASLPEVGMESFRSVAKTIHNHYKDIFAYWDAPFPITNSYTEGLNGLIKLSNRLGRGYSYEIIRAKTLYSDIARRVGSSVRSGRRIEYGPHIPTLISQAEHGELK